MGKQNNLSSQREAKDFLNSAGHRALPLDANGRNRQNATLCHAAEIASEDSK
jgi:hypothetical protein